MKKYKKTKYSKKKKKSKRKIKGGSVGIRANNDETFVKLLNILKKKKIKIEDLTKQELLSILKDIQQNNNQIYFGATPKCCYSSENIKFVRVHGSSLKQRNNKTPYTFVIPDDTFVITVSQVGDSLNIDDSFKDAVFELYKKNHTLFLNNDTSLDLSVEGNKLMYRYSNMKHILEYNLRINLFMNRLTPEEIIEEKRKIASVDNYNILFRNHIPGMIMNDISLFFDDERCIDNSDRSCSVFCLNKINKKEIECNPISFSDKKNYYEIGHILLSDLIRKEGKGVYIINTCRNFEEGTNNNIKSAMREISK